MMREIGVCLLLLLTISVNGQIVVGEGSEKVKKELEIVRPKKQRTSDGITSVYLVTNWSSTYRTLSENGDLFGEPLGKRADETSFNTWSFGLGLRNRLNNYLFWDGGIAYHRNGEQYLFTDADTMFAYQTTYNYISMPLRLNAVYGKNVKFSVGAGLIPQMFMSYKQEQQWETTTNSSGDETLKTRSGYNPFVLSAVFNMGIILDFQSNWSLLISPEARIQLNSSYTDISEYKHRARAYGITFGLIRGL